MKKRILDATASDLKSYGRKELLESITKSEGMALLENIQAYSIAIHGVRHAYHRISVSVNR